MTAWAACRYCDCLLVGLPKDDQGVDDEDVCQKCRREHAEKAAESRRAATDYRGAERPLFLLRDQLD